MWRNEENGAVMRCGFGGRLKGFGSVERMHY